MENVKKQQNEKGRRQRKLLLLMPVIVLPMLAMGFHSLGGGTGEKAAVRTPAYKGLNTALPDAHFDLRKKVLSKLQLYQLADRDSVRLSERRKNDPYLSNTSTGASPTSGGWNRGIKSQVGRGFGEGHPDDRAQALLVKLDQLKGILNRQEQGLSVPNAGGIQRPGSMGEVGGMETAGGFAAYRGAGGAGVSQVDPDLEKLSGIMDKILRIKYPAQERIPDTSAPMSERRMVSLLKAAPKEDGMDESGTVEEKVEADTGTDEILESSGFTELDDEGTDHASDNAVEAVVVHDQTLVSGESLDMRLAQEAMVGGVLMPAGTTFAGKASLSGERLQVTVSAIRLGNRVVPVSLEVIGLDGMAGIREPGSINRDVMKESADEATASLGATSFDATLGGQAAAAGVQAAKSLFSRKIRLVRVSVPAGHRVLLINKKSLNN